MDKRKGMKAVERWAEAEPFATPELETGEEAVAQDATGRSGSTEDLSSRDRAMEAPRLTERRNSLVSSSLPTASHWHSQE
jgi:hypothetical protein